MRTINFVPQQKFRINPLIKMNYSILENTNKNLFTVHNEIEKGKEKLEENKTIQMRSENERLLCEIDEIKIKMQKYLEESNISKEKFEAIKNVNIEVQNNVVLELRKDGEIKGS